MVDLANIRRRYPFAALVYPRVGLMEGVTFLPLELGAVEINAAATSLGNLTAAFSHITNNAGGEVRTEVIGGGGADINSELAWVRAVVEGAERYATMIFSDSDFIVATAHDLGSTALDLNRIPRCSDSEYADPLCPIHAPVLDAPIRWVRGLSLFDQSERLVPAVMTHLHLRPWPAERFWFPISTGVAAHTSLRTAIIGAICEGIERDAMAQAWLLRLPLPKIACPSNEFTELPTLIERIDRSMLRHYSFDATTDLGIPTVLAVQETEGHPNCELFVSCATALDPVTAFAKAIREASPARAVLARAPRCPDDVIDFHDLTHGASYYGRGGHREDFGFLLSSVTATSLERMRSDAAGFCELGEEQALRVLINQLQSSGMEAIVIDLSTDELREVGLWVVRVIIPELVPISFVHRARFLGTPRLQERARRRYGNTSFQASINPNPLPFA
jgi:ribosomal protein S12 methylthiotransferase accessory factor